MDQYEYHLIKIKFKSKLTGSIRLGDLENELNEKAKEGYRVKKLGGVAAHWYLYLEKKLNKKKQFYNYLIVDPDKHSQFTGKTDAEVNAAILTGFGIDGWKLKLPALLGTKTFYFLERKVKGHN